MSARLGRVGRALKRLARAYLLAAGAAATLVLLGLASPLPALLGAPLQVNEAPAPAAAIVCLGSGADDGLPSTAGWHRIRTSVRLYQEGFAPLVIFSGGAGPGSGGRPVAVLYAEAAQLLGLPAAATVVEPRAANTVDHTRRLLEIEAVRAAGAKDARLLVVTSTYHGLRTALCFRRAGYANVRVVTRRGPPAGGAGAPGAASLARRARGRFYAGLTTLEEWSAIGLYKLRGWI